MFNRDTFTILNYQGSKKQILNFIFQNIEQINKDNKPILDLFAGSGAVSYSLKRYYKVYSNDVEYYSYIINKALLSQKKLRLDKLSKKIFDDNYIKNLEELKNIFQKYLILEEKFIENNLKEELIKLYSNFPNIWKEGEHIIKSKKIRNPIDLRKEKKNLDYILATLYYSTTYFTIKQAIELDSLRYAIEFIEENSRDKYLASLFYAIKEVIFAKDGHMAQSLDIEKNFSKLKKIYKKNIYEIFKIKLKEFEGEEFLETLNENKVYNLECEDILKNNKLMEEVGTLYLDPPYTDMQYSRYYHILNVIAKYDYPDFTYFRGKITKGLYTEGRFQSNLSKKCTALNKLKKIILLAYKKKKNIIISFGYPQDVQSQATNRYVFALDELIEVVQEIYKENMKVEKIDYKHSNNRNSTTKKVFEYLIIGIGDNYVN